LNSNLNSHRDLLSKLKDNKLAEKIHFLKNNPIKKNNLKIFEDINKTNVQGNSKKSDQQNKSYD
jgi:hypothetical protein